MSVLRQPKPLRWTAYRRLVGVTASVGAAVLEAVAVCTWFFVVASGTHSFGVALAGLAVLLGGCLLRTEVFDATIGERNRAVLPSRIALTVILATGWVLWLLVADVVGGAAGIGIAFVILTAVLAVQFDLERRFAGARPGPPEPVTCVLSAVFLAIGASALLASVWFSTWAATSPLGLEATTVVLRFEAGHLGAIVFALFAFLAHQRRFQRRLDP